MLNVLIIAAKLSCELRIESIDEPPRGGIERSDAECAQLASCAPEPPDAVPDLAYCGARKADQPYRRGLAPKVE